MPEARNPELEFRVLEAASRIKKNGSIDVQEGLDGFNLEDVNCAVRNLTEHGLIRTYNARHSGADHWYIMALTAAGQAELQAQREDRARPSSLRTWRWFVRLEWEWGLHILIAVVSLFVLGFILPPLAVILLLEGSW